MIRSTRWLWIVLAVLSPAPILAQPASRDDSLKALRQAMDAAHVLDSYEAHVRFGPRTYAERFFYCGNSIGDFCYDRDNGGSGLGAYYAYPAWNRYHPDRLIVGSTAEFDESVRKGFLQKLSDASRVIPGDEWIVGQRVRMLLEYGATDSALKAVLSCATTRSWCDALHAYVMKLRGDDLAADTLARRALAGMPAERRCVWSDMRHILKDGEIRSHYEKLSCDERVAFDEQLWWLADPLFIVPGNERFGEQFARFVYLRLNAEYLASMLDGANYPMEALERLRTRRGLPSVQTDFGFTASRGRREPDVLVGGFEPQRRLLPIVPGPLLLRPTGLSRLSAVKLWWGFDELIARAGIPEYFAVHVGQSGIEHMAQYDGRWRGAYIPTLRAALDPTRAAVDDWDPAAPKPFEWAAAHTEGPMHRLDHQVAHFKRGDSARMVSAVDATFDTYLRVTDLSDVVGALVMTRGVRDSAEMLIEWGRTRWVHSPVVSREPVLVSLELIARGQGSARARFGSAPPRWPAQRVAISDILLTSAGPADTVPAASLEDAQPRALGRTRLRVGESVGLFWEMYGLQPGDSARFALSAERDGGGLVRVIVGRIFGGRTEPDLRVTWTEPVASGSATQGKELRVDLSALAAGRHTITVTLSVPGQQPVTATRLIQILER